MSDVVDGYSFGVVTATLYYYALGLILLRYNILTSAAKIRDIAAWISKRCWSSSQTTKFWAQSSNQWSANDDSGGWAGCHITTLMISRLPGMRAWWCRIWPWHSCGGLMSMLVPLIGTVGTQITAIYIASTSSCIVIAIIATRSNHHWYRLDLATSCCWRWYMFIIGPSLTGAQLTAAPRYDFSKRPIIGGLLLSTSHRWRQI